MTLSQIDIFWATNNCADQITIEAITGKNGEVIKPRAVKSHEMQQRSREMAEAALLENWNLKTKYLLWRK